MKYMLVNTAYRADSLMVEEMYMTDWTDNIFLDDYTRKLSEAKIFNSVNEAKTWMKLISGAGCKIVEVNKKKLFKAKLAEE